MHSNNGITVPRNIKIIVHASIFSNPHKLQISNLLWDFSSRQIYFTNFKQMGRPFLLENPAAGDCLGTFCKCNERQHRGWRQKKNKIEWFSGFRSHLNASEELFQGWRNEHVRSSSFGSDGGYVKLIFDESLQQKWFNSEDRHCICSLLFKYYELECRTIW